MLKQAAKKAIIFALGTGVAILVSLLAAMTAEAQVQPPPGTVAGPQTVNGPSTINGSVTVNGDAGFAGITRFKGNIACGTVTNPGQGIHCGDVNILTEGGGETAVQNKRDDASDIPAHPNPIFSWGRQVPGANLGDGAQWDFRIMYSDDNNAERAVLTHESSGTMGVISDNNLRSHIEGYLGNGEPDPDLRAQEYSGVAGAGVTLELGRIGAFAIDGGMTRSGSTVTVNSKLANSLVTGDVVNSGYPSATAIDPNYPASTFTITVTDSTHFTYTQAGTTAPSIPGSGPMFFSVPPDAKVRSLAPNTIALVTGASGSETNSLVCNQSVCSSPTDFYTNGLFSSRRFAGLSLFPSATSYTAAGWPATVTLATAPTAFQSQNAQLLQFSTGAGANTLAGLNGGSAVARWDQKPRVQFVVVTDSTITSERVWVGLTDSALGANDTNNAANFCAWRYSTGASDTKWTLCTSDGSTQNCTASNTTVLASTKYYLGFDLAASQSNCAGIIGPYGQAFDSVNVSTHTPTTTANFAAQATVTNLTAANRILNVGSVALQVNQ